MSLAVNVKTMLRSKPIVTHCTQMWLWFLNFVITWKFIDITVISFIPFLHQISIYTTVITTTAFLHQNTKFHYILRQLLSSLTSTLEKLTQSHSCEFTFAHNGSRMMCVAEFGRHYMISRSTDTGLA